MALASTWAMIGQKIMVKSQMAIEIRADAAALFVMIEQTIAMVNHSAPYSRVTR